MEKFYITQEQSDRIYNIMEGRVQGRTGSNLCSILYTSKFPHASIAFYVIHHPNHRMGTNISPAGIARVAILLAKALDDNQQIRTAGGGQTALNNIPPPPVRDVIQKAGRLLAAITEDKRFEQERDLQRRAIWKRYTRNGWPSRNFLHGPWS
jgi:hypothetical protein